ncbi:MAG TPA: TadE/TadG family type IV pilus assembly protein [Caulobacteraceae bacterium]|nr:TadE/TadG family type IV pilus assembly protein [Caulobacteraceae bacterium]
MKGEERAERGATALEFAILAPVFLGIVFGIINLGIALFGIATMHAETEDAARCYAVKTTVCTSAAATASYASSHYQGPIPSPSFAAATNGACHSTNGTSDGYEVTATATYPLNLILGSWSIPVSTAACFP